MLKLHAETHVLVHVKCCINFPVSSKLDMFQHTFLKLSSI